MKLPGIFACAGSVGKFSVGKTQYVNIAVPLFPMPRRHNYRLLFNIAKIVNFLYVRRNNIVI